MTTVPFSSPQESALEISTQGVTRTSDAASHIRGPPPREALQEILTVTLNHAADGTVEGKPGGKQAGTKGGTQNDSAISGRTGTFMQRERREIEGKRRNGSTQCNNMEIESELIKRFIDARAESFLNAVL